VQGDQGRVDPLIESERRGTGVEDNAHGDRAPMNGPTDELSGPANGDSSRRLRGAGAAFRASQLALQIGEGVDNFCRLECSVPPTYRLAKRQLSSLEQLARWA